MKQYLGIAKEILDKGVVKTDRTGTGTVSLFSPTNFECDLREGFPLLTTKKMFFRGIVEELLWFLSGSSNIKPLVDKDVKIWDGNGYDYYVKRFNRGDFDRLIDTDNIKLPLTFDEWKQAIRDSSESEPDIGDLGNIYGKQWRNFGSQTVERRVYVEEPNEWEGEPEIHYLISNKKPNNQKGFTYTEQLTGADQVKGVIESLKNNPDSRRHIINAWNAHDVEEGEMALPPCHVMYQFYVEGDLLHMKMYQRSADVFLGVPFNIASCGLLLTLIAREVGLTPARLIIDYGDAHIYLNHVEQIKEQLTREPYTLATIEVREGVSLDELQEADITLTNYQSHGRIKGIMAV